MKKSQVLGLLFNLFSISFSFLFLVFFVVFLKNLIEINKNFDSIDKLINENKIIKYSLEKDSKITNKKINDLFPKVEQIEKNLINMKKKECIISYYGKEFEGRKTASGEIFDSSKNTCAHKELPLFTKIIFKKGEYISEAYINDRGPFVDGREFDVSLNVAKELGIVEKGIDKVDYWIVKE